MRYKKIFNFKLFKNNDFIEIGGGYGDLSNVLIKYGFNVVLFIEPDTSKFNIAKRKLKTIECLNFDIDKPDGTPRKLLDVSKINELGWNYKTELVDGLIKTYDDYKLNKN